MGINVFLNYFVPADPRRAAEIDACLFQWTSNRHIEKVVVLKDPGCVVPAKPSAEIDLGKRPAFTDFMSAVARYSENDDINVLSNADCFLPEKDTPLLLAIDRETVYCLSRVEIKSVDPVRLAWRENRRLKKKHPHDTQDAWIWRGIPRPGMALDFCMGKPGCDNRLAYELQNAGYRIVNPASSLRLYHYHRSPGRGYSEADRVPEPYAFPQRI